jgi:hypothetical protein
VSTFVLTTEAPRGVKVLDIVRWEQLQEYGVFEDTTKKFDHLTPFHQRPIEVIKQLFYMEAERLAKSTIQTNYYEFYSNGGSETMKRIAETSRFMPHLTKGWDILRILVMNGNKPWVLPDTETEVQCQACDKALTAHHAAIQCPRFDEHRTDAYDRTFALLTKTGFMTKVFQARTAAKNLENENALVQLRELHGPNAVEAKFPTLYNDPMSVKAMSLRVKLKMTGVNVVLMGKYYMGKENEEKLLETDADAHCAVAQDTRWT